MFTLIFLGTIAAVGTSWVVVRRKRKAGAAVNH
jgi:LPXTG-motif cell wall-anchored protein